MTKTILIVEDEVRLSDAICRYLEQEGHAYLQAGTGAEAIKLFDQHLPDLVILDIMLPDTTGLEICEKIRMTSDIPIIMLTARVDGDDRIKGFDCGADDYVCKPFNPRELMSRIKAVLRRAAPSDKKDTLQRGPVMLFVEEHRVTVDGQEVALTQIEFNILNVLMANPTQVFSRQELLNKTHGKYSEFYERTIDSHIKNLRKKINNPTDYKFIKTVYGVGYKFF